MTLNACGFTAGGSGTVSSEAITISAPSTHTVHEIDFIPTRAPNVNDNGFPRLLWQGKGAGAESTRNAPWLSGNPCRASLCHVLWLRFISAESELSVPLNLTRVTPQRMSVSAGIWL